MRECRGGAVGGGVRGGWGVTGAPCDADEGMHGNQPCDAARAVAPSPSGKIAYDGAVDAPGPRASSRHLGFDGGG